jgi:hypothetical protein
VPHTYRDLFEVHLKYVDYVRSKSLLVHQYFQNIAATGSGVEVEVRRILQNLLPSRFKVTHGYIVASPSRTEEPSVSPQTDVIVVDTLVPHSLFVVDDAHGVELVPVEAVVGVLEVKRTLTKASIHEAVVHLRAIRDAVSISKTDPTQYLPGGASVDDSLNAPYHCNPLIGIIGINADEEVVANPSLAIVEANGIAPLVPDALDLDIVSAFSGIMVATADPAVPQTVTIANPRVVGTLYPWADLSVREGVEPRAVFAHTLGFIRAYVGTCCGRAAPADTYFFNSSIL